MKSVIKNKVLTYASPGDVVIENGQRVYYIENNVKNIHINAFIAFIKPSDSSTFLSEFSKNSIVDKIVFNDKITEVSPELFKDINAREIVLTNNITKIGIRAFENSEISTINLPSSIKEIEPFAFRGCYNLKEITIPNNIKVLEDGVFKSCKNLKNIQLPINLTKIGEESFANTGIENITLPNTIFKIDIGAFENCQNLKKIELPYNPYYTRITSGLFENCKNLESVVIPDNVTELGDSAFKDCINLREIRTSKNIEVYQTYCFYGCIGLKELTLTNANDSRAKVCGSVFSNCNNIEKLIFNGEFNLTNDSLRHLNKLQFLRLDNVDYDFSAFLNTRIFLDETNNLEKLSKISKSIKNYGQVEYKFASELCFFSQEEEFCSAYFKFYNRLKEKFYKEDTLPQDKFGFEKFCYNLGLFSQNKERANKAYNFLDEMLSKNVLEINKCYTYFMNLNPNGYKKEYADFITKKENFLELIKLEETEHRLLTPIYNRFELLQQDNLSRNNHHRQLAPNVKRFKEMLTIEKFKNVNKENLQIADEIGKFTNDQYYLDLAIKINEEYKKMVKDTGYKDKNMVEDPFETIEKLEKKILKTNHKSLQEIGHYIDNSFTYEWLSKNDPRNYMLGYYCSCCCHLGGAGDGIVRASLILPNVHNLVVKDSKDRIVAKATLYVNKNEQFGLFNTFQVSEKITTLRDQEKILQKLIKGTLAYIKEYNKNNKSKPLLKVNVGVGLNSLAHLLPKYFKNSIILEGINFSEYKLEHNYEGDWYLSQYCMFDATNGQFKNKYKNLLEK